jgi:VCBS repeat-containing protein
MASYSEISTADFSGDVRIDSLLGDSTVSWNYILPTRNTLYFTFDTSVIGTKAAGVTAFNAAQKGAAQALLSYAATVTGIAFVEVGSAASADFHFGNTNIAAPTTAGQTSTAWSYSQSPNGSVTSYSADAFIFLDNAEFGASNAALVAGNNGYEVLLHEIGHALGLGHPFDGRYPLPAGQDSTDNTVMSYTHVGAIKSTFQTNDLLALRWLYGDDGLAGLFGYNSVNGPSMTLTPVVDDFPASTATTGVLVANGSLSGTLERAGDRDWIAVSLSTGTHYVFELKGAATGSGTLVDPTLTLYSGAGTVIASNNDAAGSLNSLIDLTSLGNGIYYLEASSHTPDGFGTYRLSVLSQLPNRAPVANTDSFTTDEDSVLTGNLLANDSDPEAQTITAMVIAQPLHGTLAVQANGQFTYTPVPNFNGTDNFTYRASDGSLSSDASVNLTVIPVNDRPVAFDSAVSILEDTLTLNTLPFATDVDGNTLVYSKATNPAHGSLTITSSGLYSYTPATDFAGNDSFSYSVSDGSLSASAQVSLRVSAVNDAPVSSGASITTEEDTRTGGRLPAASDAEGDPVTYARMTGPEHGSVTVGGDGQYLYEPAADYAGTDGFTFRVIDSAGASNSYRVTIDVRSVIDELRGSPGNDSLVDVTGDASLLGLAGDDRLQGGTGNDTINGGAGLDSAIFVSPRNASQILRLPAGEIRVMGPEGIDLLTDVERALFGDRAVGFDIGGTGGKSYRLYQAAFDRHPDPTGLGFWIKNIDAGFSLTDAAANFISSAEFSALYGANPSNTQFTQLLYRNVLHRDPDAGGYDFWNSALSGGYTRAQVLVQFSESPENQANVIGSIVDGFDYIPFAG